MRTILSLLIETAVSVEDGLSTRHNFSLEERLDMVDAQMAMLSAARQMNNTFDLFGEEVEGQLLREQEDLIRYRKRLQEGYNE